MDDTSPAAIVVRDNENDEEHLEWIVRDITDERIRHKQTEYLVYWAGYDEPTWEPAAHLINTTALQSWLSYTQPGRQPNGRLRRNWRRRAHLLHEQGVLGTTRSRTTTLAATARTTREPLAPTSRTRDCLLSDTATSSMILPDAVGAGPAPLTGDGYAASECGKLLLASQDSSAIVRTKSRVESAAAMHNKGLKVGRTAGENLPSSDSRTCDHRRVVARARTEDGIVRTVAARATEVVKHTANVLLHKLTPAVREVRGVLRTGATA